MAVVIRPKFTREQIAKMVMEKQKLIYDALILRLARVGETFVANARQTNTYRDQTGNLRSSIGYVILQDGKQLKQNFESFPRADGLKKRPKGEKSGKNAAQDVIKDIKQKFPRGFVLIVVAGMEYAAAVESKGFDVLTASSKQAEIDLRQSIRELQSKIGKLK